MKNKCVIAIGSNKGNREKWLQFAVERLSKLPDSKLLKTAKIYETEPVDVPAEFEAMKFLNSAALIETDLQPAELLEELHKIENSAGRIREILNGPRTLDLDIIVYGEEKIRTPDLTIPHPRAKERDFVLKPLFDLIPAFDLTFFD